METNPTQPPTIPEPMEENDLRGDAHDTDPEDSSELNKSNTEAPTPQEFVELNYKGFNFKIGSCRYDAARLSDVVYNFYFKEFPRD